MADNVNITPGAGKTVASDEVVDGTLGTVQVQFVKLMDGALDGTGKIGGDAANGLDVDVTRLPSSTVIVPVTFSLDTAAYGSGDLLADTQVVASALRVNDGTGILQSIVLNDKDDQGVAMFLVVLSANVSLGTENSAPSISDANADNILGIIPIATTDWQDLGGCRIATIKNIGLPVVAASGTTSLYVGLINGTGTPTFTASGITARLGILQD